MDILEPCTSILGYFTSCFSYLSPRDQMMQIASIFEETPIEFKFKMHNDIVRGVYIKHYGEDYRRMTFQELQNPYLADLYQEVVNRWFYEDANTNLLPAANLYAEINSHTVKSVIIAANTDGFYIRAYIK